jgi:hypothetical protein
MCAAETLRVHRPEPTTHLDKHALQPVDSGMTYVGEIRSELSKTQRQNTNLDTSLVGLDRQRQ